MTGFQTGWNVAATKRIIEGTIRPAVGQFLAERGLELNPQKTGIVTLGQGFDFLGFTFRRFGTLFTVKPRKEKVQRFLRHVQEILVSNKQARLRDLVVLLNPVIRGWATYYRYCNAKQTFARVDHLIFWKLWRWSRRRHPEKSADWVRHRYFGDGGTRSWWFGERNGSCASPPKYLCCDSGKCTARPVPLTRSSGTTGARASGTWR
jgi:RNA-directed DNA polymerase